MTSRQIDQVIIVRPRVIRSDNGGFRVYRPYVQAERPSTSSGQRFGTLRYGVPPGLAMCVRCGCTNTWGCRPACSWADPRGTLCTRCAERITR